MYFVIKLLWNPHRYKCVKHKQIFKGPLMQIWKSSYMFGFIKKQYPENFPFLILRILELFTREVCKLSKK